MNSPHFKSSLPPLLVRPLALNKFAPPPILIMHDLFNRFGRKKTICCGLFFSAVGSFGSVVLTLFDDGESKGTDAVQ